MVPITSSTATRWPLLVGPTSLVVGVVLLFVSNELIFVGPFDRATFGWAFCVPLLALAPVASGLAGRWTSPDATRIAASLVALGAGTFMLALLIATTHRTACEPVSDPVRIAGRGLPLAIVTSLAYLVPALLAFHNRARLLVAVATGLVAAVIGGVAMLLTVAALFPAATCVPVQTFGG